MNRSIKWMVFLLSFLMLIAVPLPVIAEDAPLGEPFDFTIEEACTVQVGQTVLLMPSPDPSDTIVYTFSLASSGSVASVSSGGAVTGLSAGIAAVRVQGTRTTTDANGQKVVSAATKTVIVTVEKAPDPFSFKVLNNGVTIEEKETVTLVMDPPALDGIVYTFSMMGDEKYAKVDEKGVVTGVSKGTAYIYVQGQKGEETHKETVTVKVSASTSTADKKLVISSSTSLDKKVTDANFYMSVTFNASKSLVEYTFEIDDDNVATIDETSGLVRLKRAGEAVITVNASAEGYTSASKDFTLYVSNSTTSTTGSTSNNTTSSTTGSSTTTASTVSGSTIKAGDTVMVDGKALKFDFTGKITVNGMDISTTNSFAKGTPFALIPDKANGDWWRTPNAFSGSRGVYTAKNEGVSTIIYADTSGKQYILSINSYSTKKDGSFTIPKTIPVGAIFAIQPPVDGGRWTRNPDYLAGAGGTYIPQKAGTTKVTYEAGGKTYTLNLTIVDQDGDSTDSAPSGAAISTTPPSQGQTVAEEETAIILN